MASEGGGKIKSKRNPTQSKPYDRDTSLLGKLKNSVKDLLLPSWLSVSSSSPISTSGETKSDKQNSSLSNASSAASNFVDHSRPGRSSDSSDFIAAQDLDDSGIVTFPKLNREGQKIHGELYPNASYEPPPPNVNIATLYQGDVWKQSNSVESSSSSQISQMFSNSNEKNYSMPLDSIDKDSMEVVETPIRSIMVLTGAASRASESAKRQRLWSPESVRHGKPFIAPVTEKPSFNASLFGTLNESNTSLLGSSLHESSFYSGKTRYGGAAGERKSQISSSPYKSSLPLRKQVKASPLNQTLNATTSATAQRILETLEKMSTPLGDVKKIPRADANDSVLSFTPSSYRRASFLTPGRSSTRPLQIPNFGAPKSQHQSISQAVIVKNRSKHSILDKRQSSLAQDLGEPVEVCETETSRLPTSLEPSLSKLTSEVAVKNVPSSTGKIKEKKFSQHISRGKEDDEVVEVPNLRTDFTLPITNLNPIPLHSVGVKSHSVPPSSIPTTDKLAHLKFTFSTPIQENRNPGSSLVLGSVDKNFKFSSPINASNVKINAAGAEEGSKSSPEPAVGASSVVSTSFSSTPQVWGSTAPRPKVADIGGTSSSFKTYNKWPENDSSAASDVVTQSGFSLAPAASLKTGSVMDVLGKGPVVASVSFVPPKSSTEDDLMSKFKKAAGSWECYSCMLSNKPDSTKCVACDNPKPNSNQVSTSSSVAVNSPPSTSDDLMAKFKKPPGSWECQGCLIVNKPESSKCVACETPRTGSNQLSAPNISSGSLSSLFKKPPGNWECDTCMIQNPAAAENCLACDSPKPGLQAAGVVSKTTEPSKTSSITISSQGGFVLNVPTTTATTVGSGGFKFGNTSTSSVFSTSSSGFQFSQTATSKDSSASTVSSSVPLTGGFKFGSSSTSPDTGGFKFGSTAPDTGGFKFGSSGSQSSNIVTEPAKNSSGGAFVFGLSSAASTSKPNVQFGLTTKNVSFNEPCISENHSISNGCLPVNQVNSKTASAGPVFGVVPSSGASQEIRSTAAVVGIATNPQINSNANSLAVTMAPTFALSTSQALVVDSVPKSSNSLFQFGATVATSQSNSTGLGMNSISSSKPLSNGGFTMSSNQSKVADGANSLGSGLQTNAPVFGVFGQSTISLNPSSSVSLAQPSKRSVDLNDVDAPSAKKTVNFGLNNNDTATNGLFTFGASKGSPFGNSASINSGTPSGGFMFGSTPGAQPSQINNSSQGFQFSTGASNVFSFTASASNDSSKSEVKAAPFPIPTPASFNFGGTSQQTGAPFVFGAKPTEPQSSSTPFVFGAGAPNAPSQSFNIGTGGDRPKIKAMRRKKK
ncbi:nuclear pore complex protein Nup153-like isoform X1 [Biomphalaria glabrata]|uniref:Nuclear pore complex protein Nup153 n=1 Tax=Biomphalaria glabrata TaxID=6526 RepID=A0A2C9JS36_BIOGL|nr:nuclear pore complex protein Nup153-like isoform X1 [Biomphalaria glabrata]KAI8773817.1 nuclear pore complex protein Nup153 isoform X2 [Biomphalaria glabrata]